jgi:peptide/nickel transport system substrate-binding protein
VTTTWGCTRVRADRDPYIDVQQAFTEGPLNMTALQSPEIDAQLEILRTTTGVDERKAAVEAIGEVLDENVPNTYSGGTLTVMAARDVVKDLDGWVLPDGTTGNGAASAQVMWGHVWTTE